MTTQPKPKSTRVRRGPGLVETRRRRTNFMASFDKFLVQGMILVYIYGCIDATCTDIQAHCRLHGPPQLHIGVS